MGLVYTGASLPELISMFLFFNGKLVGKNTSPMDPMGYSKYYTLYTLFCYICFSKSKSCSQSFTLYHLVQQKSYFSNLEIPGKSLKG